MTRQNARPVNQTIRINILRVAMLMTLPLIFLGAPAYQSDSALGETLDVLGVLLIIGGVLGRFWSILYIGGSKNREVMQSGPYSMMRHPLYTFSIMAVTGFGLMLSCLVTTLVLSGLVTAILVVTARKEEIFLTREFGLAYTRYAARVPMMLPKPSLFETPDMITVNVGTLRRNFFDAVVFLALIPLAEAAEKMREMQALPTIPLY